MDSRKAKSNISSDKNSAEAEAISRNDETQSMRDIQSPNMPVFGNKRLEHCMDYTTPQNQVKPQPHNSTYTNSKPGSSKHINIPSTCTPPPQPRNAAALAAYTNKVKVELVRSDPK